MRIISGTYRGKHIKPPKSFKARPTTDFAKESLFNILSNHIDYEEIEVLDLFSGTGSIAYEFVSRGVKRVTALEMDPANHRFISRTAQEMDMDQMTVLRADVFRYLKKPYQSFDLIFADPPYDHKAIKELPDLVFSTGILNPRGIFILEHPGNYSFTAHTNFQQQRKYGGVNFSLFSA